MGIERWMCGCKKRWLCGCREVNVRVLVAAASGEHNSIAFKITDDEASNKLFPNRFELTVVSAPSLYISNQ